MHDKNLFRPRPSGSKSNGNGRSESVISGCKSEDRMMMSKSLCDEYSPTISKSFLHRHMSSDLSSIGYRGYLLKRSNRPYNPDTASSLVATAGTTSMSSFMLDGLIAPELGYATALDFSVLKPKPVPILDDACWSDLDSPSETCVVSGPLHKITPDVDPQQLQQLEQNDDNQEDFEIPLKNAFINDEQSKPKTLLQQPKPKPPLQQAMDSLSSFFGLNKVEQDFSNVQSDASRDVSAETAHDEPSKVQQNEVYVRKKSAPIKVGSASQIEDASKASLNSRSDSFYMSKHRRQSAPILMESPDPDDDNNSQNQPFDSRTPPPADFVDPTDGHLWRAKYCVLEEGILYFYRNTTDGECVQAISERKKGSSLWEENSISDNQDQHNGSIRHLSKSPMPRPYLHHLDSAASGESGCMWEKRVILDCVGAVRSAESEYGTNSFELVAVCDNDDDADDESTSSADKLVLQARNRDEMNEWLFQFHRSVDSFMMNLVDAVAVDSNSAGALNIHHPKFLHQPLTHDMTWERQQQFVHAFPSPRLQKHISPMAMGLSHGHGRSALHRRRATEGRVRTSCSTPISDTGNSSLSSTPDTGGSPGSTNLPFAFRDISPAGLLRPAPIAASPPRVLRPPRPELNSELSGSQSDYTETERPIPTKPIKGKYVPPMLRNKQGTATDGAKKGKYIPPALRAQQQKDGTGGSKYIPPQMRNRNAQSNGGGGSATPTTGGRSLLSLAEMDAASSKFEDQKAHSRQDENAFGDKVHDSSSSVLDQLDVVGQQTTPFKRGGCADPQVVHGSILDASFIPRKASRVGKVLTEAFGCFGGGDVDEDGRMATNGQKSTLRWETGAVSECGIRESNEDAYLIASDLIKAFQSLPERPGDRLPESSWRDNDAIHKVGLFAVFDGHCGDQAARFASEKLAQFLYDETRAFEGSGPLDPSSVETILSDAIQKLDYEFCHLCTEGGREWECGSTALAAMVANEHLVIANLGDCRGILCRSVDENAKYSVGGGWNELERLTDDADPNRCWWKAVTNTHSPSKKEERARIELANGWVTTETEIPIGQLRRMDFWDKDVVEILKRCFSERCDDSGDRSGKARSAAPQRIMHISRVCGELAVSRALGDRDFKASFNNTSPSSLVQTSNVSPWWDGQLYLPYPDQHNRKFQGDVVSSMPDIQTIKMGEEGVNDEFLLLACDGLWDVMDADDAVRVTRDLLFHKKWTAKKASARLAELAIHLGSSDNVTVIVIRFFRDNKAPP